jgi:hypothetical protein
MLLDIDLYRAAAASTVVAIVALIAAGITIALFFGGAGSFWGPVNDLFVVVTALALILPILAVDRLAAANGVGWMRIVTVAAVLGALLIAIGQMLLVLGVIDLQTSFVTGGVGFIPIAVWIVAMVVLAFGSGALPAAVGWAAAGVLAFIVVDAVVGIAASGPILWVAGFVLLSALVVWLWILSSTLLSHAAA